MASGSDSAVINVDDVTVDSSTTEKDEVDRPVVRFSDEVVADNGTRKRNNNNGGETCTAASAVPKHLQTNGPSASPSSPRRQQHSKGDDTPLLGERDLILAATLVLDAKAGRNLLFRTEEKYIRSYILYHKFYLRWLLYFFIILDLSLAFFERPALDGVSLPYWGSMLIELMCLAFFTIRKLHVFYFQEAKVFFRDTKNYMIIGTIVLTILDMITYIIWVNQSWTTHPVRWSRPLRPFFIINFSDGKQIRRAFRNIRRTVPDILHVLVLFIFSVLLFGLLGLKLFYKRSNLIYPDGQPYFKTYLDSIWDLYVLVTTANNPDVMMPAYDYDNWFVLFFVVFIVINLYIFMSIVLATIYYNFKKNLKNEIKTAVYCKRKLLVRAFDILKVEINGRETVTPNRWTQLMGVIMPTKSAAQIDLLMQVLDINGDTFIYKEDFLNLSDLLHVELTEVKDRQSMLEKVMPAVFNSPVSNFVKMIVRHKIFRYTFDLLIFVNAFFIGFDVDVADWFFLIIFSVEIILKLYVYGPYQFSQRLWNIFDFFVIGAAVAATIVENIVGETNDEFSTLDIILVLRVLRLFKLFGSIQRFKGVIQTIVNIGPSITTYGGVMFVFYYFFAIIGMELFQGLISYHGYNESVTAPENLWCGNPALQNTTFYRMRYCSNNFNTVTKAFVLLTELTVVNQWHVLTSGFVFVTSKVARLYFFLFHVCCVVIVLNIFTAFILEAFILEYSLRTAHKLESAVEAKIKQLGLGIGMKPKTDGPPRGDEIELVNEEQLPAQEERPEYEESDSDTESLPDVSSESGLRFHLRKRNRKKVEVLLQQMFQSEIEAEDAGPEEIDEGTEFKPRRRRLTLDNVG
ncbi:two pore calcium channel protein 1-like [Littorina saxatilis]|uniref:two pore calcium channel protein 1-like n=1 Tax=Littorina saxatilis TaxID=31220 RepID=UPI0038B54D0E